MLFVCNFSTTKSIPSLSSCHTIPFKFKRYIVWLWHFNPCFNISNTSDRICTLLIDTLTSTFKKDVYSGHLIAAVPLLLCYAYMQLRAQQSTISMNVHRACYVLMCKNCTVGFYNIRQGYDRTEGKRPQERARSQIRAPQKAQNLLPTLISLS